jgi:hypothetical protein
MTTAAAPALSVHPLTPPLRPGDVVLTWCAAHGPLEEHRYDPHAKVPLTCLRCEKEKVKPC